MVLLINSCHRLVRRFLWGATDDNAKIAWVSWDLACKTNDEGGLGIKDWGRFNKALLGKWRWRILTERESLWHKVLNAKYKSLNTSKPSIWWHDLQKVCFQEGNDSWFDDQLARKVENGWETHFWTEQWSGGMKLCEKYPRLFSLSTEPRGFIEELGMWQGESWVWRLNWRTELRDFEIILADQLLSSLGSFAPSPTSSDGWRWLSNPHGTYSVWSAYGCMRGTITEQ